MLRDREKKALIAAVRVLDRFTIARTLDDASGRKVDANRANDSFFVLIGAETALRSFPCRPERSAWWRPWGERPATPP